MKTLQSPSLNGRAQKTLAHQLDRLDEILDGFAEALQNAVGEAVAAAVGAAVRDAVAVAVREALAAQTPIPMRAQSSAAPLPLPEPEVAAAPGPPSRWTRFRTKIAAAGRSLGAKARAALAPRAERCAAPSSQSPPPRSASPSSAAIAAPVCGRPWPVWSRVSPSASATR